MPNDTVTLALDGNVSLEAFAQAIPHLQRLLSSLGGECGVSQPIDWIVHDLQVGSTTVTVRGESSETAEVERVVRAYATVGKALEQAKPVPFSDRIVRHAHEITRILSERVIAIRFETPEEEAVISHPSQAQPKEEIVTTYGAIEGRIQTLTSRKGFRFILYDSVSDRAISCYLQERQEDIMREAWDRRAIIEGVISRERFTGRPLAIRKISQVHVLPELEPGSYLKARGIAPIKAGGLLPEQAIRRLRDAT